MASLTRWRLAGNLRRVLPDLRGRDRLLRALAGGTPVGEAARTTVAFGPRDELRATVDVAADGSFRDLYFARYEPPFLVPVLDSVLAPGRVFWDVGANIGVYSMWAAALVGADGQVYACEPVPTTRSWLEGLLAENPELHVEVLAVAVSDAAGEVEMETIPTASGLGRVRSAGGSAAAVGQQTERVVVRAAPFDELVGDRRPPDLVKIDVEGHELAVLRGMSRTLEQTRPVVVFEAWLGADDDGSLAADAAALLAEHGYRVFSMRPVGLEPFTPTDFSHNLLALHPQQHREVEHRLASVRFRRNQNF